VDVNRYAYANNDPINMSDANGHASGPGAPSKEEQKRRSEQAKKEAETAKLNAQADSYIRKLSLGSYEDNLRLADSIADPRVAAMVRSKVELMSSGRVNPDDTVFSLIPAGGVAKITAAGIGKVFTTTAEKNLAKELAEVSVTSAPKKVHGNSLLSDKPTYGYNLVDSTTGELLKKGQTSAKPPSSRYSGSFYDENNASMNLGTEATSKAAAKAWENHELKGIFNQTGKLPPMNKGFN
jgi:hypothetical protein